MSSAPASFIPRSEWTSTSRGGGTLNTPVGRLFVHHTADSGPYGGSGASLATEYAYWRTVRNFHVDVRGWSDIAYSGGITPSGRLYDLRGFDRTGGHTLNYNSVAVAIVYAGNTSVLDVSSSVVEAYKKAIFDVNKSGFITSGVLVQGHRDVGTTACPGDDLYSKLGEIRKWKNNSDGGEDDEMNIKDEFDLGAAFGKAAVLREKGKFDEWPEPKKIPTGPGDYEDGKDSRYKGFASAYGKAVAREELA